MSRTCLNLREKSSWRKDVMKASLDEDDTTEDNNVEDWEDERNGMLKEELPKLNAMSSQFIEFL